MKIVSSDLLVLLLAGFSFFAGEITALLMTLLYVKRSLQKEGLNLTAKEIVNVVRKGGVK